MGSRKGLRQNKGDIGFINLFGMYEIEINRNQMIILSWTALLWQSETFFMKYIVTDMKP